MVVTPAAGAERAPSCLIRIRAELGASRKELVCSISVDMVEFTDEVWTEAARAAKLSKFDPRVVPSADMIIQTAC